MRHSGWLLLMLVGCGEAAADPKPAPAKPRTSGIRGTLTYSITSGVPGGGTQGGFLQCTFEVNIGNTTRKVKTDAQGHFEQRLAPGKYGLRFLDCTKGCGVVIPEAPSSLDLAAGQWKQIDFGCSRMGK